MACDIDSRSDSNGLELDGVAGMNESNIDIEKLWEQNTAEAKTLVRNHADMQMHIASLALEVCEITRGGGQCKYGEKYTIVRFAKEIGINSKTLSGWIAVRKNVYNKLDADLKAKASFTAMHTVGRFVDSSTPAKTVQRKTLEIIGLNNIDAKMLRYCGIMRAVAHNFEKTDTSERCKKSTVEEVLFYCQLIATAISIKHENVRPKDHGQAAKFSMATGMRAGHTLSGAKQGAGFIKDEDGFSVKITKQDLAVMDALNKRKTFVSPTVIGQDLGGLGANAGKTRALRSLNKWLTLSRVEKNNKGLYRARVVVP